jgi:hypothetical protein
MPKVDSFVYLLVIAFIILGAFVLITPLVPITSEEPGKLKAIKSFEMGTVGFVEESPGKTLSLGSFRVGELQDESLLSIPAMDVEASYFGGRSFDYVIEVPEWYFDTMEGITLTFDVESTNSYGNLIIKWNGKEVYKGVTFSIRNSIEIGPELIGEKNTLEVLTEPTLRFWASTIYKLKDFEVDLRYGPARLYVFEIFSNELQAFRRGEIDFYAAGQGELEIKLNGVGIYKGSPTGTVSTGFNFTTAPLVVGENILSFDTRLGALDLLNTELRVYLLTTQISRARTFNITDEFYGPLNYGTARGRIDFELDRIARQGSLEISMNGNRLAVPALREGTNTVHFTKDDANQGMNRLEFSGTGTFEISTVTIGVEKA